MSRNIYDFPICLQNVRKVTYRESPAHIGCLGEAIDFIPHEHLVVKKGVRVYASAKGVVSRLSIKNDRGGSKLWYDKFGNYIMIKHPGGEFSVYEHLEKNSAVVNVGDEVKCGKYIANTGDTGYVACLKHHLHYAVFVPIEGRDLDDEPDVTKFKEDERKLYFESLPYETQSITWKNPDLLKPLLPKIEGGLELGHIPVERLFSGLLK